MWKIIKWFFGILFVLYVIGSLMDKSSKNTESTNTATNVGVAVKKPEKPVATLEPKPTSAELLTKAKKLIDEQNSDAAIENLQKIELVSKEYPEAQKLLKKIHARQKILLEKANAETEIRMATARKDYAKELENQLLNIARMDTTITTSGKNNTTLKIKYILVSRVFVNELTKDGKLVTTWRSMGFKKIICTTGYNEGWTMNLEE